MLFIFSTVIGGVLKFTPLIMPPDWSPVAVAVLPLISIGPAIAKGAKQTKNNPAQINIPVCLLGEWELTLNISPLQNKKFVLGGGPTTSTTPVRLM
jgi:hypothetical protein